MVCYNQGLGGGTSPIAMLKWVCWLIGTFRRLRPACRDARSEYGQSDPSSGACRAPLLSEANASLL
jgi:hypothetical protein